MLMKILRKIFGSRNERIIKKLRKDVEVINSLEEEISKLTDKQLRDKTNEFRRRLAKGEKLDDIMHEAFAVVREAAKRTLGMRHFDVQVIGAIVLHQGKIAEMKTGEGKTLVATMPAYLNALALSDKWVERARKEFGKDPENWIFEPFDDRTPVGKGVHVVTVNDYLAKRDAEWMGPVYEFLGLKVSYILTTSSHKERVEAYHSDITYGTNNEFGFDYLRDNMVMDLNDMVQRELHYAIVDEVDSVLIDEARTPLIISGPSEFSTEKYILVNRIIPQLQKSTTNEIQRTPDGKIIEPDGDFWIDEKNKMAYLTSKGILKCERLLGIKNLYQDINADWIHHIIQALRAHYLFHRDVDYVVKDGKVLIVDEFTGRILPGRRWSDGLHQAIEAKEGVKIQSENQTLATITFQNYFKMYDKLAGMTGTAETEAIEFKEIYNLDVVVIPTNKPMIREDRPDFIFPTEKGKFKALVRDIKKIHSTGQPILIGTVSIEKSEMLSKMLKKEGIKHNVLNAKHHEREAEIIAQAGRLGAVTISTNMAGRGTDIILGGNPEALMKAKYKNIPKEEIDWEEYNRELEELKKKAEEERKKVVELGGLFVIGTERHESRRIDNQLRGRAGRQGDPGVSQFYVSLEDNLMRLFGSESMKSFMLRATEREDIPLTHKWLSKGIERAQRRVEEYHFEIRKHLLEYDNVMNVQREVVYKMRRKILEGANLKEDIYTRIDDVIYDKVGRFFEDSPEFPENWPYQEFNAEIMRIFNFYPDINFDVVKVADNKKEMINLIYEKVKDMAFKIYEEKEKKIGEEYLRDIERYVLLQVLDNRWKEQLRILDHLKEGINLRAYGHKDPLVEFKRDALGLFEAMLLKVSEETLEFLFRIEDIEVERPQQSSIDDFELSHDLYWNPYEDSTLTTNASKEEVKQEPIVKKQKVGPNDPCPCGSGKKYKHCCGAKVR